jgi:hypothetical protein
MDELTLDRLLERTASATAYPRTPALRGRVLAAIAVRTPDTRRTATARRFVVAITAVVLALFGASLAVPASRSAIAELFGIEGAKIERLPTPTGGATATPLPAPADIGAYARPSSLADVQTAIGFAPALAPGAGDPQVFVARYPAEGVVILRYGGFDLWEMRARDIFLGKGLPEGVVSVDTAVSGHPARWIEGGPHIAYLYDERGAIPGSERTVTRDTLIWRTDFALYRLETTLPMADAIRIAESLP